MAIIGLATTGRGRRVPCVVTVILDKIVDPTDIYAVRSHASPFVRCDGENYGEYYIGLKDRCAQRELKSLGLDMMEGHLILRIYACVTTITQIIQCTYIM